jgi:endonuclease III
MLRQIIETLERTYGAAPPPVTRDPLEMILYENCAYLVSDEQRLEAFEALRRQIGTGAGSILCAPAGRLLEVAKLGGPFAGQRVEKLRRADQLATGKFKGKPADILKLPLAQAKKALMRFPGIGEPGAEKILLFTGTHPIPALESNGLRVLTRLGFGEEKPNYAATYRSAQQALAGQAGADCKFLIRMHQALRRHGQEVCRRKAPLCGSCPLADECRYFRAEADKRPHF